MKQTGYKPLYDKTPKYTVKEVAEMMELSTYTIRYYENAGLIPFVARTDGNIRMFSDHDLSWLRLVHCLRATGLPIEEVKHYIDMCLQGDSTIPERAEIIFAQEKSLRKQIQTLQNQMEVLKYKKSYYQNLLKNRQQDRCNPMNPPADQQAEPNIAPQQTESMD